MNTEKSCYNCEHFVPYYILWRNKFRTTACGQCSERYITKKDYGRFPFAYGCDLWKDNASSVKRDEEQLYTILRRMAMQIDDIIKYLEAEK